MEELKERGGSTLKASRMTFANLAAYFEEHYLKPAEYVDDARPAARRYKIQAQHSKSNVRKIPKSESTSSDR